MGEQDFNGYWLLEWSAPPDPLMGVNLGPFEMIFTNGKFVGLEATGTILFGTFKQEGDKLAVNAYGSPLLSPPTVVMRTPTGVPSRETQNYRFSFDIVTATRLVAQVPHGPTTFTVILKKKPGGL